MRRPTSRLHPIRSAIGVALLLSLISGPARPVAAQSDDGLVDETTYTSPQFAYTVTWDTPWVADEAGTRSRPDRDDVLTLRDEESDLPLVVAGIVTDLLPEERLETIVANRTEGDEDLQAVLDPDNDDGFAAALLAYADDGSAVHEYVEISEGEAGEWLRVVDLRVPAEDLTDAFDATGTVEIDGDAAFRGNPSALLDTAGDGDDEDTEDTTERRRPRIPTADEDDEPAEEPADDEPTDEATGTASELEGVDGTTYTSPNFDHSVTWDEDVWEVDETSVEDGFDRVTLSSTGDSSISLSATTEFDGDVTECLVQVTEFLADGDQDLEITDVDLLDDEDGEPIQGEADDRAFVANEYTGTFDEDDVTFIYYIECRVLIEDEANLIVIHFVLDAEAYPDEAEAREDLTVVLPEDDSGEDETPATDDDATATPEDDETADPEDDETPTVDDETPPADDETTFTSETYGFDLSWDGETWVEDGRSADAITLSHGPGTLSIAGVEDYDGDAVACVQGEVDAIRGAPGVTRIEPELGEDGRRVSGGNAERFFSLYRITASDGTFDGTNGVLLYLECRTLVENDAVLVIQHLVFDADAYADEAALAEAVVETIELP